MADNDVYQEQVTAALDDIGRIARRIGNAKSVLRESLDLAMAYPDTRADFQFYVKRVRDMLEAADGFVDDAVKEAERHDG